MKDKYTFPAFPATAKAPESLRCRVWGNRVASDDGDSATGGAQEYFLSLPPAAYQPAVQAAFMRGQSGDLSN